MEDGGTITPPELAARGWGAAAQTAGAVPAWSAGLDARKTIPLGRKTVTLRETKNQAKGYVS